MPKTKLTKRTQPTQPTQLSTIYIMGKKYEVPKDLTIMKAIEYAGYQLIRGCGCRGGFCGACGTIYRTKNDYKIKVGLACQTVVEDGMYLAQIPFFPVKKPEYNIDKLQPTAETIFQIFPEIMRCLSCNTCTKACPQDINVMDYIQSIIQGDIPKAADLSFDCLMCGLCALRCPGEISQFQSAILARRLFAKYLQPKAKHLSVRLKEMSDGKFDDEIKKIMQLNIEELKKMYNQREIEPEEL
ncbi:MAG: 4Fe-4S dicluster domain-containing protein [Elusimicrobiota bacterium]